MPMILLVPALAGQGGDAASVARVLVTAVVVVGRGPHAGALGRAARAALRGGLPRARPVRARRRARRGRHHLDHVAGRVLAGRSARSSPAWCWPTPSTATRRCRTRWRCATSSRACSSCRSACCSTSGPGSISRDGRRRRRRRAARQSRDRGVRGLGPAVPRAGRAAGRVRRGSDRGVLVRAGPPGRGPRPARAGELRVFFAASVVTMFIAPLALRFGPGVASGASRFRGLDRVDSATSGGMAVPADVPAPQVVILGFGVGGELLAEVLREADDAVCRARSQRGARAPGQSPGNAAVLRRRDEPRNPRAGGRGDMPRRWWWS